MKKPSPWWIRSSVFSRELSVITKAWFYARDNFLSSRDYNNAYAIGEQIIGEKWEEQMSGGHFGFKSFGIQEIAEEIESVIYRIGRKEDGYQFTNETAEKFLDAIAALKKANVYVQRIDWLLSGDDGEESFHQQLKEDLGGL